MSNKVNNKTLRKMLADDIEELRQIINSAGRLSIIKDLDTLKSASDLCKQPHKGHDNLWHYYTRPIDFGNISDHKALKKLRPRGIKNVSVRMSIDISGVFNCNSDVIIDPLDSLSINLQLFGTLNKLDDYYCSWHLDRHPDDGNETLLAHPKYHFQHGGNNLLNKIDAGIGFGQFLLIEPPRLAHPPLDIVLGVDFVLSNFFGEKRKTLFNIPGYKNLLIRAQQRFWQPYFLAMASKWHSDLGHKNKWDCCTLNPQLA